MKLLLLTSTFLLAFSGCATKQPTSFIQTEAVQLSPPVVRVEHYFFDDETEIHVGAVQPQASVSYSKGSALPTWDSLIADTPIRVSESSSYRFCSTGGGFIPSREVTVEVLKLRPEQLSLTAASFASPPYDQVSQAALTDREKARKDFRNSDWLGYQKKFVTFVVSFYETKVRGITLSVLEDQSSWVFAPASLKATFYDTSGRELATATTRYLPELQKAGSAFRFLTVKTGLVRAASVKLEVENLGAIPDWHPGAGSLPWLFVDEMLLR